MDRSYSPNVTTPIQLTVSRLVRAVFFTTLLSTGHSSFADTVSTLKLAHVAAIDSAIGRGATRFATDLERVSAGKLSVDIIPLGALGGIRDNWVQMQVGSLDMQVIDLSAISLLESAKAVQVSLVPFLFKDQAHFRRFSESEMLADLLEPARESAHIRYLGIVEDRSPRVISTTKKPVRSIDDMQGLKIRSPPHPMFVEIFKTWGALPSPIPASEMFMALNSGLVDGEDNGAVNLVASSNAKVIKYFSPINWSRSGVAAWISEHTWKKLDEEQQDWIGEAIASSASESKNDYSSRLEDAMTTLPTLGIEVLDPDIDSFKDSMRDFHTRYEGSAWPAGLVDMITDLQ